MPRPILAFQESTSAARESTSLQIEASVFEGAGSAGQDVIWVVNPRRRPLAGGLFGQMAFEMGHTLVRIRGRPLGDVTSAFGVSVSAAAYALTHHLNEE